MTDQQKPTKPKEKASKVADLSLYRYKKQRSKAMESLRKKADELGW